MEGYQRRGSQAFLGEELAAARATEAELDWGDAAQPCFAGRAIAAGYLYAATFPKHYGGSEQEPDVLKAQIIREEFAKVHGTHRGHAASAR